MKELETVLKNVGKAREALIAQHEDIMTRKKAIEAEEADVNRNLKMLEVIEGVQNGTIDLDRMNGQAPARKRASSGERAPRGTVQGEILALLQRPENNEGMGRAQIIEALGAKGDKKREASISNSLAAMKKGKKLGHNSQGSYLLP